MLSNGAIDVSPSILQVQEISERLVKAFELACKAHRRVLRKRSNIPYIVHPMDVASILFKNHASEDLVIAGLLHDVVEDTNVRLEEIERHFGRSVSELVRSTTEAEKLSEQGSNDQKEVKTWRERKSGTIKRTESAGKELKSLECADKLSNIREMIRDYWEIRDDLWRRFDASADDRRWYYESMVKALGSGPNSLESAQAYEELKQLVAEMFGSMKATQ